MKLIISGTNLKVEKIFREYINKKLVRILRHFENPTSIEIIFRREKLIIKSEIIIVADGKDFYFKSKGRDIHSSFDTLIDRCERHISKFKSKQKEHRQKHNFTFRRKIVNLKLRKLTLVKARNYDLKPMSLEEAVLQLVLLKKVFYIFREEKNFDTGVVFRDQGNKIRILVRKDPLLPICKIGGEFYYRIAELDEKKSVKIKRGGKQNLKNINIEEALINIKNKRKIILFINNESENLAVLYKRADKTLGYIEL